MAAKALTAVVQEPYILGISTRSVDNVVKTLGMEGIGKSQVSRLCGEIDERVNAFLGRPIEGDWPYVWLDATYVKVRRGHQMRSPRARLRTRMLAVADPNAMAQPRAPFPGGLDDKEIQDRLLDEFAALAGQMPRVPARDARPMVARALAAEPPPGTELSRGQLRLRLANPPPK